MGIGTSKYLLALERGLRSRQVHRAPNGSSPAELLRDASVADAHAYQLKPAPAETLRSLPLKAPPTETLARLPMARW